MLDNNTTKGRDNKLLETTTTTTTTTTTITKTNWYGREVPTYTSVNAKQKQRVEKVIGMSKKP